MKTRENLKLFTLSGALLTLSAQVCANPEFAIDYEWSAADGIEFLNDTLLVKPVNVTCPNDGDPDNIAGYLVATASALFKQLPDGHGDTGVSYYVKKNNEDPQNHQYSYSPGVHVEIAPTIQRVDQCIEGETVSYGFGARVEDSGSKVTADKPRLVVKFVRDQLPE